MGWILTSTLHKDITLLNLQDQYFSNSCNKLISNLDFYKHRRLIILKSESNSSKYLFNLFCVTFLNILWQKVEDYCSIDRFEFMQGSPENKKGVKKTKRGLFWTALTSEPLIIFRRNSFQTCILSQNVYVPEIILKHFEN